MVRFRISGADSDLLDSAARRLGISTSELIRRAALREAGMVESLAEVIEAENAARGGRE